MALAWDSHVHHASVLTWFAANRAEGWATCSVTESGFVRVSSNPKVLPSALSVADARTALAALRTAAGHQFLTDDVSLADADVPVIVVHRQVTDVHLLTLARRHGRQVVTFDAGLAALGGPDVHLLRG